MTEVTVAEQRQTSIPMTLDKCLELIDRAGSSPDFDARIDAIDILNDYFDDYPEELSALFLSAIPASTRQVMDWFARIEDDPDKVWKVKANRRGILPVLRCDLPSVCASWEKRLTAAEWRAADWSRIQDELFLDFIPDALGWAYGLERKHNYTCLIDYLIAHCDEVDMPVELRSRIPAIVADVPLSDVFADSEPFMKAMTMAVEIPF